MSSAEGSGYRIAPFDAARHDRAQFSCGVDQVDNFFKRTANKPASANNLRVFVMVAGNGDVVGFYAINAHAVDYRDLPSRYARTRPGHGSIPAAYLSMIGVDRRYAGHGFGGDLLADALSRIAAAAESVGISVVILDILDDGDPALVARRKRLYEAYGFLPLPSNPMRLFLPVETIQMITRP